MDAIKLILSSPAGSFGFVFGIMLLSGWIIFYVTRKVTEITSDHGVLTKSSNKLDTHIDEIRKDLSFVKGSLAVIQSGAAQPTKSHSPVSLTEKGVEIATDLKVEDVIFRNWDKIILELEKNLSNKNAYDIQQYCIETAGVEPEKFFAEKDLNEIKAYAFKNGNNLFYYSGVFGVLIRDKYLKIKGIDVSEVDANDPNKK